MKKIILFVMILACLTLTFVGCKGDGEAEETTAATTVDPSHVHEWGEVEVVEAPDCRFAGEGKKTCSCGAEEVVEIPALGHDVPTSSYVENPTFTRVGVQSGLCTRCEKKIRSDAAPLKKAYMNIGANLASVDNVYFNGFWVDSTVGGADAAYTNVLGSEIIAKATGASKLTYTFAVSDATKSTVVAYSVNDSEWTRKDVKGGTLEIAVPAEETVVRVMFVDTALDMTQAGAGLYLKSVAADKGEVAPCVKEGVTVLVISDNVTDIEKDVFTLAGESLGYTSLRVSRDGIGYVGLAELIESFASAENGADLAPDYVVVSLGENDAEISGGDFMTALSDAMNALTDVCQGADIMLVAPVSGTRIGQLETVSMYYNSVYLVSTEEWTTVESDDEIALLFEGVLVERYGEEVFFEGYYEDYETPEDPTFSDDKTNNNSFGALTPMEKAE